MHPRNFGHARSQGGRQPASAKPPWLYYKNVNTPAVRPFLTQSDLSVENSLFRLKPKSGFLTQLKKGFFDLTFFN